MAHSLGAHRVAPPLGSAACLPGQVQERRNFLSQSSWKDARAAAAAAAAGSGGGSSASHLAVASSLIAGHAPRSEEKPAAGSASSYAFKSRGSYEQPSFSDDEEDAAYASTRPLVIEARAQFVQGGRGASSRSELALLGKERARARAGVLASSAFYDDHDDASESESEEEEEEEAPAGAAPLPDGSKSLTAPGWGEEPPARKAWWRAREKVRKEEIRQKPDSVAAEMAARRESLVAKSLDIFRPLVSTAATPQPFPPALGPRPSLPRAVLGARPPTASIAEASLRSPSLCSQPRLGILNPLSPLKRPSSAGGATPSSEAADGPPATPHSGGSEGGVLFGSGGDGTPANP